ncbi:hypothetical protein KDM89_21110, partial [Undibacterium sp. LFS511W]|nr:hypothetical protein [Undibacterium luofuense]
MKINLSFKHKALVLALFAVTQSYVGLAQAATSTAVVNAAADGAEVPVNTVRERYTKYEYQIPMRDGVKLFTVVYVPKDSSQTYPFLMQRTPYGSGVHAGGES